MHRLPLFFPIRHSIVAFEVWGDDDFDVRFGTDESIGCIGQAVPQQTTDNRRAEV